MLVRPLEYFAHTAGRQSDARICRAIVTVRTDSVSAGKEDIADVPALFVQFFSSGKNVTRRSSIPRSSSGKCLGLRWEQSVDGLAAEFLPDFENPADFRIFSHH
jgi:hypothetical protein